MQEALHEKRISDIADMIKDRNARLVLICGPSSSGKTTFAKRLCIQLHVNGMKTLYMGTDDYYKEFDERVYDENGEVDLESIRAIDTELFKKQIRGLLDGEEVDLPRYDFSIPGKVFGERKTKIDKNTVIVIEHNLDVIKLADHIIDMGLDGGHGGGTVLTAGTPEQVAKSKMGYTPKFLKEELKRH